MSVESDSVRFDERLARVAQWYLSREGDGWPMRWGEDVSRPTLLGTAYALAIVRHARRTPASAPRIQRALRFIVDGRANWSATRHPVYSILGLTEWPETLVRGGMGDSASVKSGEIHATLRHALKWLRKERDGTGWPGVPGGHVCRAWTAKVLYALGRLRQRGDIYRSDDDVLELTLGAAGFLLGSRHALPNGAETGAWPACGSESSPSVANTALAVIALSHREVESAAPAADLEMWKAAYHDGAKWLLANHELWDHNEVGEHDLLANDRWHFAVWSLAPRACLSAGMAPSNPNLSQGLDFAFRRWREAPTPGWYIEGDGLSGYSIWSAVQLGQVLKLAIARLDPLHVLRALHGAPTTLEAASDVSVLIDGSTRTAELRRSSGQKEIMVLGRQTKRFELLKAFAEGEVPAGGMLAFEIIAQRIGSNDDSSDVISWEALKGLTHQVNESARELLRDRSVQLFRTTTRTDRGIIVTARCRFKDEQATTHGQVEDVTGISALTGESY